MKLKNIKGYRDLARRHQLNWNYNGVVRDKRVLKLFEIYKVREERRLNETR